MVTVETFSKLKLEFSLYSEKFQIHQFMQASYCSSRNVLPKRGAHENHPNFLRSLGHRPRTRGWDWVALGLESPECLQHIGFNVINMQLILT